MRFDGIENPLYVDDPPKSKDYSALPLGPTAEEEDNKERDDASSIGTTGGIYDGGLYLGKPKRRTNLKRFGIVCVIGAFALAVTVLFFVPYHVRKVSSTDDTTSPMNNKAGFEGDALPLSTRYPMIGKLMENLRRIVASSPSLPPLQSSSALPNALTFDAVLSAYGERYEAVTHSLERRLARWWSAPETAEIVEQATVWDARGIAEVIDQFHRFQRKFGRGTENFIQRLTNFFKNFEEIERLNGLFAGLNTTFGVTQFADWSDEEFKQMLLPVGSHKKRRSESTFIREMNPIFAEAVTDEYPEHFDWREKGVVTPVKNQGKCGSCWAFATAATVESAYAVAHNELRSLSEQELLDCNLENNACNGGDCDKAFRFVHEHGLMTESAYPYLAQRQNTCRLASESETTKIDVAYFINPDEKSILDWLVNFGPVNIGISVPPDMKPYKGGVYRPSDYDCKFRVVGEHALLIVGYGTSESGEKYWIVKNSWGNTWGIENGYVNFARGVNACGIESDPIGLLA